jgi:glucokinase
VTIAIGIDIGGTKTAVGLVDSTGCLRSRTAFATDSRAGFLDGVGRMAAAVQRLAAQAGIELRTLSGLGIGCPGPVNPVRGTIHNPYTLPGWPDGCNLVAALRDRLDLPVRLENDADAAAMGEAFAGAARGAGRVVMLTFGTGIGSGILIDGAIYRGCAGDHPELGHILVNTDGPPCYCGTRGCFESLASGTAIGEAGKACGFADSRAVFEAAAAGAERAQQIIQRATEATFVAAWALLHTFLPERVVLGGGLAEEHYELFAEPFRRAIMAATLVPRDRLEVVRARLGNDAGVVGAASLLLRHRPD